jgi:hypothetical protein
MGLLLDEWYPPGGAGKPDEIVGGANQRLFGLHVLDATQEEMPEPSCPLDLIPAPRFAS